MVPIAVTSASSPFSRQSVMRHLELACEMLDEATLYEQCAAVYHQLVPMYEQVGLEAFMRAQRF